MYCPSCGKSIAAGSAFCMHCGKPVPTASAVTQQPAAAASSEAPVCPKCRQIDAVRKVSAILATDVTRGSTPVTEHGTMADRDFSVTTYKATYSSSVLAQKLALPAWQALYERAVSWLPQPLPKDFPVARLNNRSVDLYMKSGSPEIATRIKLKVEQLLRAYTYELAWRRLYYCARCDGVFILGEGQFAPADDTERILCTSPLGEDFCVTEIFRFSSWGLTLAPFEIVAGAIGSTGYYTAATSGQFKAKANAPDSTEVKSTHQQLASQLVSQGWQQVDQIEGDKHHFSSLVFKRATR